MTAAMAVRMAGVNGELPIDPETGTLLRRALLLGAPVPVYVAGVNLEWAPVTNAVETEVGAGSVAVYGVRHSGMMRIAMALDPEMARVITYGPSFYTHWGWNVSLDFEEFWASLLAREDLI